MASSAAGVLRHRWGDPGGGGGGQRRSVDIFEIKLAFVVATRECSRPAQLAPSEASRSATPRAAPSAQWGGAGASPSSSPLGATRSIGKHRQSADKALKTYKSLPPQRPRPRGVAPGHRVRTGARGAVSVANAAKVTAGKLKHCPPFAEPYPRECHCTPQGLGDCFLNEGSTQFVFLRDKLDLARGDGRSSGADASTGAFFMLEGKSWLRSSNWSMISKSSCSSRSSQ